LTERAPRLHEELGCSPDELTDINRVALKLMPRSAAVHYAEAADGEVEDAGKYAKPAPLYLCRPELLARTLGSAPTHVKPKLGHDVAFDERGILTSNPPGSEIGFQYVIRDGVGKAESLQVPNTSPSNEKKDIREFNALFLRLKERLMAIPASSARPSQRASTRTSCSATAPISTPRLSTLRSTWRTTVPYTKSGRTTPTEAGGCARSVPAIRAARTAPRSTPTESFFTP
jgi:hypothetical protein